MKKILFTIALMFTCMMVNAQIKPNYDSVGLIRYYEFNLGKYEFRGDCIHGIYGLAWTSYDEDEVEMLYYFLHQNKEEISKKFGLNISSITMAETTKFIDYYPYEVYGGWAVTITIVTDAYAKYLQAEEQEKEDRKKSLQNIF